MNIELSTNIILMDSDQMKQQGLEGRFQLVYSSQLYETFFSIYARFHCKRTAADQMELKKIDFILINYKGPKMLQIVEEWEKPKFYPEAAKSGKSRSLDFKLYVKARIEDEELTDTTDGVDPKDKGKRRASDEIVTMDLTAGGMAGNYLLKANDYIRIERGVRPMAYGDKSRKTHRQKAFVKGHFDSEFFFQDGAYIRPKRNVNADKIKFTDTHLTVLEAIMRPVDNSMSSPGFRCTPGDGKIFMG